MLYAYAFNWSPVSLHQCIAFLVFWPSRYILMSGFHEYCVCTKVLCPREMCFCFLKAILVPRVQKYDARTKWPCSRRLIMFTKGTRLKYHIRNIARPCSYKSPLVYIEKLPISALCPLSRRNRVRSPTGAVSRTLQIPSPKSILPATVETARSSPHSAHFTVDNPSD